MASWCWSGVVTLSPIMGEGVVVRPDQVSLGVLVSAVPRDAIDAAVVACGVGDKRSGGKLAAHVTAYLTMAMFLFSDDDYEEVATKVTGSLSAWGCWDASSGTTITKKIILSRRDRTCPRAVKRARHNSYRVKKPNDHSTHHTGPPTINIRRLANPRAA